MKGSFGFLIDAVYSDPSNEIGFAMLGLMNLDGAGNVTGSYTSEVGDSRTTTTTPVTGALTGTYSGNPDGTGSLMITLDKGTAFTFATVITDGGQGIQLAATSCSNGCEVGGATIISGVARAAYAGAVKGSYGFLDTGSPSPGVSVGVSSFDGAGNVAASLTFIGVTGMSGQPSLFSGSQTGTYTLNQDGTGALTFGNQTYVIVFTDGGSGAFLLQTNRAGNGVSFGTGRLQ